MSRVVSPSSQEGVSFICHFCSGAAFSTLVPACPMVSPVVELKEPLVMVTKWPRFIVVKVLTFCDYWVEFPPKTITLYQLTSAQPSSIMLSLH